MRGKCPGRLPRLTLCSANQSSLRQALLRLAKEGPAIEKSMAGPSWFQHRGPNDAVWTNVHQVLYLGGNELRRRDTPDLRAQQAGSLYRASSRGLPSRRRLGRPTRLPLFAGLRLDSNRSATLRWYPITATTSSGTLLFSALSAFPYLYRCLWRSAYSRMLSWFTITSRTLGNHDFEVNSPLR